MERKYNFKPKCACGYLLINHAENETAINWYCNHCSREYQETEKSFIEI